MLDGTTSSKTCTPSFSFFLPLRRACCIRVDERERQKRERKWGREHRRWRDGERGTKKKHRRGELHVVVTTWRGQTGIRRRATGRWRKERERGEREKERERGTKKREWKRDREGSERAQGITSRRVKEETRKGRRERDGAPSFRGELLNSRGPGLEAGFVAEPSRCMYMRWTKRECGQESSRLAGALSRGRGC